MSTQEIIKYLALLHKDAEGLLSYSQRQALAWAIAKLELEISRRAKEGEQI